MAQKPPPQPPESQDEPELKRRPSRGFPAYDLKSTLVIAQAIADNNAGKPYSRLSLAEAIGRKPDSSALRALLGASIAYGLTEGSYNKPKVSLTPLGQAATMPRSDAERVDAIRKAARNVPLYDQLYIKFDQAKLPGDQNFRNTLVREHGVDAAYADEAIAMFRLDGKFSGLIRNVSGSDRVDLQHDGGLPPDEDELVDRPDEPLDAEPPAADTGKITPPPSQAIGAPKKRQFFVAHGSDHEALKQLESMLRDLNLPFVTAINEPHGGRPISKKVEQLMRESSGALFIFSGDETVTLADGTQEKRPRMNVVYELGAASLLYDKRIVLFKESGVVLSSDFSDLGHISYEKGELRNKSLDLLKELITFGVFGILPES